MADDNTEMGFWGHIEALRTTLLRIGALLLALTVALFGVMRWVFDNIILWPCSPDFPAYRAFGFVHGDGSLLPDLGADGFDVHLMSINLGTQFMTHMSASFYLALVIGFPAVIYMLWHFVSPGLHENERRAPRRAWTFANVMFYVGVLVGYFVIFPLALRFLSQYSLSAKITNTLTLDSYMDSFYTTILAMGAVFELPLLAWLLGRAGVLKRSFFGHYRRYAVAVLLIVASIITPTTDLFTLAVAFVPLYTLYELSALLVPRH